ncbi:TIGR01244 family sulfur transferase [Mameliella sediminis]|uniref:TIGR01244 family sulfur transferase n=1 Tax=Mameliella sediminis TaxID=2836866 RepID=UPI001C464E95|nr:TIGR01244 family sulfur transferase [Mameliella sediminis]MBY6117209.1 TIGR01244 family phosphatase [Antarctobacter heliothermus]MBY6147065.1 TIGR01244 family phosphatase [Mameliella alba]MBV7396602.1 TIGR01244 family phosphatase [Mameliella sediminis]MBY6162891.1 TIGR01244 family phosphatase [Mameliella alba]MBY6171155.1 TIGR01244 family phosphatase [Mameliella alba]
MTPRELTELYHVSPQIDPQDAEAIKEAGYVLVIDNRPDAEIPPSHQTEAMRAAIEAQGVRFEALPITHQTMTAENILRQSEMVAGANGKVLAYCASGTRCSVIWALGQAETLGADAVIEAAGNAGYNLAGLRPTLETLAKP